MRSKHFGGKVTKRLIQRYQRSPRWIKGRFRNLERTDMGVGLSSIPGIIYKQLKSRDGKLPGKPLPVQAFDRAAFLSPSTSCRMIWYGHSVIMMRINDMTIMIDPMLGPDTTPIAPLPSKRFSEDTLALIDDFPEIDLVLITHDHYDHLDYESIQRLKSKVRCYYVALGIKRHLVYWGVDPELVTEFDWWDSKELEGVEITFTPTRHFSGRGIADRQRSLWGGWSLITENERLWFSGDGGYGQHFKEVGKRLGPFDFAFMECGQYNDDWPLLHLFPDESIQAAIDAGVMKVMPVHWAGFSLSYQHTWSEPAIDFIRSAKKKTMNYNIPELGQIFSVQDVIKVPWWKEFE